MFTAAPDRRISQSRGRYRAFISHFPVIAVRFLAGKTDSVFGHITEVLPLSCSISFMVAALKGSEAVHIVEKLARILKFCPTIIQQCVVQQCVGR